MTSQRETGTSPLEFLTEDQTCADQAEVPQPSPALTEEGLPSEELSEKRGPLGEHSEVHVHSEDVGDDRLSVVWSYTPSSTTVRPYRFSEHIHQDRHIFLKGASLGIGCGSAPTAPLDAAFADCFPWTGGAVRERDYYVDEQGNVFLNGQYLGMALGNEGLRSLHRVQLALPSADGSRQRPQDRFPHVHQHHQPPPLRRRPFNEQLNTYVDTQKRIRSVQCLDDLYRSTTSPIFPYLTIPSPRRRRPPPPPAKIRVAVPRGPPPSASRQPPSLLPPSFKLAGRPVGKAAGSASPNITASDMAAGLSPQNPDLALAQARHAMHELQQASSNQNYADYFLAKEGRQGTLGRLFESYPKRVLVHPGRLLRQRTDIVSRARLNWLK